MTNSNRDLSLLETILRELEEAIVACDRHGRILLYNEAARTLFRHHRALILGGSLYQVLNHAPIAHALQILRQRELAGREAPEASLVCATADNTILLHCRIRPLASGTVEPVLLFTFADLAGQLDQPGGPGRSSPALIEALRRPLANLAAAAANLRNHPEMDLETRRQFEEVVFRESTELTGRFADLARQSGAGRRLVWPLADVNSADLLGCLVQRLSGQNGVTLAMTGVPLWLRGDSYALLLLLEALVAFVRESRGVTGIDLEALLGDRRVCLDLVWAGEPIAQGELERLRQSPLPEGGGLTVAEVLDRHDSELWSQPHRRPGFAVLRLPLPDSSRQWQLPQPPPPARGERYDFSLAGSPAAAGSLADRPLTALDCVVFDLETTGLQPESGGEILALAAVRLANGRILASESFERLVKPHQPLSENSTSLLAITREMIAQAAPISEVLPQFHAFAGRAVLVAHNASFDLNFFRSLEMTTGVRFDQPLLDTLLLSLLVDEQRTDLTLPGLGRWLEVELPADRTLLDTCLLTAQIFLRLLDLLAARGLTTLGQLLAASARLVERKRAEAGSERAHA